MPASKSNLYVGTSGWTYDSWRGPFYPDGLPKRRWLTWYSETFGSTEINGSFYRTPSLEAVRSWSEATPAHFRFAWKASKFITHWKRLKETSQNSIELMASRLGVLGSKCGPVLFQLPPNMKADQARLDEFFALLPRRYRYAFEFRHASWYDETTYALLKRHKAALCISDHHDAPSPWVVTAPHVYVRAHGPGGQYKDHYTDRVLTDWARRIRAYRSAGRSVYVYFDNDQKSAAPQDARRLLTLVEKGSETPAGHAQRGPMLA